MSAATPLEVRSCYTSVEQQVDSGRVLETRLQADKPKTNLSEILVRVWMRVFADTALLPHLFLGNSRMFLHSKKLSNVQGTVT